MRCYQWPLLAPLALVLAAGSAAVIGTGQSTRARVYTVGEVQESLAHQPAAWVGRTIRVRGVYTGCGPPDALAAFCLAPAPTGLATAPAVAPLPLVWGTESSWLAVLRRLPVGGRLVPQAQTVHWGAEATYRVQLRAAPASLCPSPPCYQALLLDAAPDAPGEG